jgi:hypothetical protein
MYMRGIVTTAMVKMGGILKGLWSAMVSMSKRLLSFIIVNGTDLMIRIVISIKQLLVWILSNIKQKLVPQIIVADFNTVDRSFANKRLGLIGRSVLTTALLIPLAALKHLSLGLWRVLVVMKDKLLKRG